MTLTERRSSFWIFDPLVQERSYRRSIFHVPHNFDNLPLTRTASHKVMSNRSLCSCDFLSCFIATILCAKVFVCETVIVS